MIDSYYKFSQFLKERYGEKVWKISIDAGFTCPHWDKETGKEGCVFCRNDSFSDLQSKYNVSIEEQVASGILAAREKYNVRKFIVYFQASTNTFAPVSVLQDYFERAISFDGVVGLSVSTRPDCLPPRVLELVDKLTKKTDVWIELGLQSVHEKTLKLLNRGHTFEDYQNAVAALKNLPVRICTHLMIGLPGEDRQDLLVTAKEIADSGIHEVKLHPLLVLDDTPLAEMFRKGEFRSLQLDEYASLVCDFLEYLPPSMVIQRLTAEAPEHMLLAPRWSLNKLNVIKRIEQEFKRRGTRQGQHHSPNSSH